MACPHSYRTKHSETKTTSSQYGDYFAKQKISHIPIQNDLLILLKWIDTHEGMRVDNLCEFIGIPSVAGVRKYRPDTIRMMKKVECWLQKLFIKYDTFNIGHYEINGEKFKIPPVILAKTGQDKDKYTIGIYAHLDVKEFQNQDWETNCPYHMIIKDNVFYGAGTSSGKGPLLMWFHAIYAFQKSNIELPVNIKFCIESMYNLGHKNLEPLLRTAAPKFLRNIDHWIVTESCWIGSKIPCLSYGAPGVAHFRLTSEKVDCSDSDPVDDLTIICRTLMNDQEEILIHDFNADVSQIVPEEEKIYQQIREFNVIDLKSSLPDYKKDWDQTRLLMQYWRLPSLQICDTEHCTCDKKNTEPQKVKRLLLFKIVPNQIAETVQLKVIAHIEQVCQMNNIRNKIECKLIHGRRPWIVNWRSKPYEAARRATIQIYKEEPSMIREDVTIPIILLLQRVFKCKILLLPVGNCMTNARRPNENITAECFTEGTKLMCAYIFQIPIVMNNGGDEQNHLTK